MQGDIHEDHREIFMMHMPMSCEVTNIEIQGDIRRYTEI